MSLEQQLDGWRGPSSDTERDKQDRTERMIREAIEEHDAFDSYAFSVYAKGSYANNTNVRADSDVDVAVQCHEVTYWREAAGVQRSRSPYKGIWTPEKLRDEVGAALRAKFPGQVDASGSVAFGVRSSSARVEADVVPCFNFRHYFASGGSRTGTRIVTKEGKHFENYPAQQLKNGNQKNSSARTKIFYKQSVRIMKRVENAMLDAGEHKEVPSFFIECLVYNCPDELFLGPTWTETVRDLIVHIWDSLQGAEPDEEDERWLEVNECKYLFHSNQKWTREDGRAFAKAAWNYLGYA
jgi:hypothetical protein